MPAAVSDDKWLLELFVVQRNLRKSDCSIYQLDKHDKYNYPDAYLVYYFGYAVTSYEYRYICSMNAEYESDISNRIYELHNTLMLYEKKLTKKERKCIKKTIKILEKLDVSKDLGHAKGLIDNVIERPGMVIDYLENMDNFRQFMEG
jgi:hypothetical protein